MHLPPQPPTLTVAAGPTEIDTVAFDDFAATSGTFGASSSNSDAILTYGVSGGTATNTVLGGVAYDVSGNSPYGTLFVNSTTGAYTFVPNSDAINALTAPTTDPFTITVSDGTLSANQTFTITINGTNDAAVISGTTAGGVIEAGGVANAAPDTPTVIGTLTDTDVDNTPNTFTAVSSATTSASGYGTFTMTAAGVWTYTVNEANSAVQALNVGNTLTDSFTVTTVDGTAQGGDGHHPRHQRRGRHFRHHGRRSDRGRWRRQCRAQYVDRDRHAHRHRRRQYAQYLHGGKLANGERERLRHLHDDGGWRVDLHARQRQQRGAGAQCRQHADRQFHGDHHRRYRTGGDGHHPRQQRRSHHFRHHDRFSDRGWLRQVRHADRDRHAHRHRRRQYRPTPSRRSARQRRARAATAPSR